MHGATHGAGGIPAVDDRGGRAVLRRPLARGAGLDRRRGRQHARDPPRRPPEPPGTAGSVAAPGRGRLHLHGRRLPLLPRTRPSGRRVEPADRRRVVRGHVRPAHRGPPAPHPHRRGRPRPRGPDRRAHLHVRDRPVVLDLHRRAAGRGAGARPDREDHRGRLPPGRRGDPRHCGAARRRRPVDAHRPAPRLRCRRHAGLRRHLPPDPDRGLVDQRRAGRRRLAGVLRLLGGGRPPPVDARPDRAARHRTAPHHRPSARPARARVDDPARRSSWWKRSPTGS